MESNELQIGDTLWQETSWAGNEDVIQSVTDTEAVGQHGRRFERRPRNPNQYYQIHESNSAYWMEKHDPWQRVKRLENSVQKRRLDPYNHA